MFLNQIAAGRQAARYASELQARKVRMTDNTNGKGLQEFPKGSKRNNILSGGQPTKENGNKMNNFVQKQVAQAEISLHVIMSAISQQENRESDINKKNILALQKAKEKYREGSKRAAIRYMKKSKLYEMELEKVATTIDTMEAQVLTIESAINNVKVLEAMKEGSSAMKSLQGSNSCSSAERVNQILDGVRDTADYAAEVTKILSEPIGDISIDEEGLFRELEDMHKETKSTRSLEFILPEIPNGSLKQSEKRVPKRTPEKKKVKKMCDDLKMHS